MISAPTLLSHPLSQDTPGYGGNLNAFLKEKRSSIADGDSSNSETWKLANHHGTHVDCPYHFCESGKTVTDYRPEEWVFTNPFLLRVKAQPNELLGLAEVRESIPLESDCLIIKTGFEKLRRQIDYWKHNPGLTPELGEWLRTHRPQLQIVGFDFISLTAFQHRELGREAHRTWLCPKQGLGNIRIVEDMKLSELSTNPKRVLVSPLLVEDGDGSPVTVWAFN